MMLSDLENLPEQKGTVAVAELNTRWRMMPPRLNHSAKLTFIVTKLGGGGTPRGDTAFFKVMQ